jgi:predicted amidohydrolase YtcJ
MDLIFTNGIVVTMDEALPVEEALAVRDGRIAAVGTAEEILPLRTAGTEVVDLGGRAVLPGFVEAHGHPTMDMTRYADTVVDIRPVIVPDADAVIALMRDTLASAPATVPLIFSGLDPLLQSGFPEPTRPWLDELAGERPVLVMHNSGHLAWANTAALRLSGLPADAPDPTGAHFERDADGKLTGKAYEVPAIFALAGPMQARDIDPAAPWRAELQGLAARGITAIADLAFSPHQLPLMRAHYAGDHPLVRLRTYEMSTADMRSESSPGDGDDMFRQIGIKLWVDGSPWVGNIDTSFPYLNTDATLNVIGLGHDHRGQANYTGEQLAAIVGAYYPLGWQMACHVLGDHGVDTILDVYEAALTEHPRADHRLRLEHCGAMTAAQFRRAARLGVTCSLLIDHLYYWGDVLVDGLFGEEIGSHWMRARSALDAGIRISLHNDSPVTPVEPLRNISVAVTRTSRTGRVLAPEERITVEEALRAQTIWPAKQLFADEIIGTLAPGKYADLVVLSADPRVVDPAAIADLTVEATYLAGRTTYSAGS